MLTLTFGCGTHPGPALAAAPAAPTCEIAFASLGPINAELFFADADGRQLVFYEAGIAEVNNITIVSRRRGTTQIASIDLATGEHRVLTSGPGEKWSPRFLAAGRIAYASGGPEGGLEFVGGTAGDRDEIGVPAWSPDRRHMLFHREVERAWPPLQRWHSRDPQFSLLRTGVFPAYDPLAGRRPGCVRLRSLLPDGDWPRHRRHRDGES